MTLTATEQEILQHILSFCERKHKNFFTKEELFVYIWHRDRRVKCETVLRTLRRLVRKGFLLRKDVYNGEATVVYYAILSKIRAYLRARGSRPLEQFQASPSSPSQQAS